MPEDKLNAVVEAAGGGPVMKFLEHNRWTVVAVVLCVAVAGCTLFQAKATNPVDPAGEPVTRSELKMLAAQFAADTKAKAAMFTAAEEELAAEEAMIEEALNAIESIGVSVAGPWGPAVTTILGIAGLGLLGDNRRKGKIIKNGATPKPPA